MSVVIVGAGQSGGRAAQALRAAGYKASITLVGDEPHLPYERPPLSKALLEGTMALEKAHVLPADFYVKENVALHTGVRATAIDRDRRRLHLGDGRTLAYEHLILATGVRRRTLMGLPELEDHLFGLRTLDDMTRLKTRLHHGARVLVIGGGFLGMELAATACLRGCTVTVLERSPSVLFKAVASEVAKHLVTLHESHGVRVLTEVIPKNFRLTSVSGPVQVELSNGETLTADTVIPAIGSLPNSELAEAAGLDVQDGIVTDAIGRTSDPHIYAIGDVSRHHNMSLDRVVRVESWQNAQNQATSVARAIVGDPKPYGEVPWFWTDQFSWNLQILGYPHVWDHLVIRGDVAKARFSVLYLSRGRVVGANMINNGRELRPLRQLIEDGAIIDPEIAAEPTRSLPDSRLDVAGARGVA